MNISNYQPNDIDMSRKLVYDKNVITLTCIIYYEGDDGSEVLFEAPDEEFADAFVTRWNEAIAEDESLQGAVDYKQTCVTLVDKEVNELQLNIEEAQRNNILLSDNLHSAGHEIERLRTSMGNIEADIRCFLDELPYVEDTALTRQLRKHVWNDDDTRQRDEMRGGEE